MFRLTGRVSTNTTFRGSSFTNNIVPSSTIPLTEIIESYKPTDVITAEGLEKPFNQLSSKINNVIYQLANNGIYLNDEANS